MTPARPWSRRATRTTVAAHLVAAAGIAGAAVGAAQEPTLDEQYVWLNLAVLSAALAVSAQVLWLLHGRRNVSTRRLDALRARFPATERVDAVLAPRGALVTVPGAPWLHVDHCILAAGKVVAPAGPGDAPSCPVCRPELAA